MSDEREHVEGDQVEASRPVFKSNAAMLKYMHDKWADDSSDYVDLLQRTARNQAAHERNEQLFLLGYAQGHAVATAKVTLTIANSFDDHQVSASEQRSRWRQWLSRLWHLRSRSASTPTEAGSLLLQLSRVVFGRRANEEIFVQIVADMREEIEDAKVRGALVEASFARLRGTYAWGKTAVKKVPLDVIMAIVGIAKKLIAHI